jgi:hypothetical protein
MECVLRSQLKRLEVTILAYRGDLLDPQWVDEEPGESRCQVVNAYH